MARGDVRAVGVAQGHEDEDDAKGLEQAHVEGDGGRVAVLLGELVDGGAADRGLLADGGRGG